MYLMPQAGQFPPSQMEQIGSGLIPAQLSHRYADKNDLPQIYVMYLDALKERGEEYDEQRSLDYMLLSWSQAPCVLLCKGSDIIGFAGLYTYKPAHNHKVYLREYMFYIMPENRGVKSWRSLCRGVQDVSREFNLPFVGEHRLTGSIKHHERLIRMAGATPKAIISVYEA
jgi:hypothetical protein